MNSISIGIMIMLIISSSTIVRMIISGSMIAILSITASIITTERFVRSGALRGRQARRGLGFRGFKV